MPKQKERTKLVEGLFTQGISVSGNDNTNARMGAEPIHFAALVLLLTLTLCVDGLWLFLLKVNKLSVDSDGWHFVSVWYTFDLQLIN